MSTKRILSLVLALVMVLGTFGTVFAAVPETASEKAEFLMDQGILKEGKLDQDLKRRDSVVLLSRLFDVEEEAKSHEATDKYDDIDDAFYNGYIGWATEKEYVNGKENGKFDPNGPLTAQQFSTMLLRALGYQENGKNIFDEAYAEAKELGILKGVDVEEKEVVTRGDMAAMTYNALNVKIKGTSETLAEFLGIEMPVDKPEKLEVVEVYTENLAEVVVELSNVDLVKNKEALLNPANYTLGLKDVKVYNVDLEGDNLILTLVPYGKVQETNAVTVLTKGTNFKLTIRNVAPEINTTTGWVEAKDNAIPRVEEVEFMGTHGIKVVTSEPISNPLERNFRISDRRTSMIIEQYGRNLILTPYHSGSFDKNATELVVEGLEDYAYYKAAKTVEKMELNETDAPKVVEAYRSGSKLTLIFDQDVYHDSIKAYESRREFGNVAFTERRVTFNAETANKVDTNVVEYTFEREIPRGAEVTVENVQNHSKVAMEKDVVVPVLFVDEYAPVVISDLVTSIRANDKALVAGDVLNAAGTKGLTITFDKHIKEFVDHIEYTKDPARYPEKELKDADLDKFFKLYVLDVSNRTEITSKVNFVIAQGTDADGNPFDKIGNDYIVLDFANDPTLALIDQELKINNKVRDYDYVLEVRDFSDLSGNRMVREYIDFQILPAATDFAVLDVVNVTSTTTKSGIVVKEVNSRRGTNRTDVEITLSFNATVDQASASDERNYYINGGLEVDEAIVERDGRTVTLVIENMKLSKFKTDFLDNNDQLELEISPRVQNLARNSSVASRYFDVNHVLTGNMNNANVIVLKTR